MWDIVIKKVGGAMAIGNSNKNLLIQNANFQENLARVKNKFNKSKF